MKVFLSFSGEMSHKVASELRDWLPKVIQSVKPFLSEDVEKGKPWFDQIGDELSRTAYGIVCVTPYNFRAPWINFEAGAISKAVQNSHVTPFLFRVESSTIQGPLQQFQSASYNEKDVFKLLCSINSSQAPDDRLALELLQREFEMWWPELQANLDRISDTQEAETETGFGWLYTAQDLARKQGGINCKEIWVITPDLLGRTVDPKVIDSVHRNIERDICYTFITLCSEKTTEAEDELKRIFAAKPNCFVIKEIAEDEFRRLAVTDYVVINPKSDAEHPLDVFLELPIESRGYWIQVDSEAAVDFVDRFSHIA